MGSERTAAPGAWHSQPAQAALEALEATTDGLSQAEAEQRLATYGPNRLPQVKRRGLVARFLSQFNNILIYVLLGSATITAALGHMIDTMVILAVVIANAAIGVAQEGKAERAMESIRQMLAPRSTVLRDGRRASVEGEAVVPGDVVVLEAGDKVPADVRLLSANGLQAQEAALTGESVPVDKQPGPVAEAAALGDRACMAFSSTLVTAGRGTGIVVATGAETEIGRISGLLSTVEQLTTPLIRQMDAFARWLSFMILTLAALLLAFGHFVRNLDFAETFMAVVGLSVAAIPEGLPAVLTITLAVGVQAMARRNAIVRRLPAIETLGSVSVICTDKTGTLTRNEMMAASVVTRDHTFTLDGTGYEPAGEVTLDGAPASEDARGGLGEVGLIASLCNDADLREHDGTWTVEGDPMEGALLALAGKLGSDAKGWRRLDTLPFDAAHRFMATLHRSETGQAAIMLKGAPERVIDMCARQRTGQGGDEPLDGDYWHGRIADLAAHGQRLLALAVKPTDTDREEIGFADVEEGLVLVGLVGLIDPPRRQAVEAVAACREAGIRVKMITGDHAGTAAAIGRQVGLENPDAVLTGAELDEMDDAALAAAVPQTDIFARTSPEDKLRLVMALQSHGITVAMTGDGVNDAPALKRADAGIAMGRKGSEAAKEVADLVLADDNFASIAAAVREGRTVYDNIKKVISWTLPTNAGEAIIIIVALLFGMALPVTPVQILWINLVTSVTLGVALAFEPTEANTMRRPPRPRGEPLLTGHLAWHIVLVSGLFACGVFALFTYAVGRGYPIELARTIAMNTLVVMEIAHLFFIRNIYGTSLTWKAVRGTRVVWITVIVVTVAQFAITYLPPLQAIFGTAPVPLADGLLIVGAGVALFTIIEIEKQMRLSFTRGRNRRD